MLADELERLAASPKKMLRFSRGVVMHCKAGQPILGWIHTDSEGHKDFLLKCWNHRAEIISALRAKETRDD